jgi:hypothetical protein
MIWFASYIFSAVSFISSGYCLFRFLQKAVSSGRIKMNRLVILHLINTVTQILSIVGLACFLSSDPITSKIGNGLYYMGTQGIYLMLLFISLGNLTIVRAFHIMVDPRINASFLNRAEIFAIILYFILISPSYFFQSNRIFGYFEEPKWLDPLHLALIALWAVLNVIYHNYQAIVLIKRLDASMSTEGQGQSQQYKSAIRWGYSVLFLDNLSIILYALFVIWSISDFQTKRSIAHMVMASVGLHATAMTIMFETLKDMTFSKGSHHSAGPSAKSKTLTAATQSMVSQNE